jgi:hypothetical protein
VLKILEIAVVVAAVVLLVGWNFLRLYRFERCYSSNDSFPGQRYECIVGGLDPGHGTLCMVGADPSGLHVLSHPGPGRSMLSFRRAYRPYKKNLFLPWKDVNCRSGMAVFKECLWFDMPSRKVYLNVPKDIGGHLLADAGRDARV